MKKVHIELLFCGSKLKNLIKLSCNNMGRHGLHFSISGLPIKNVDNP